MIRPFPNPPFLNLRRLPRRERMTICIALRASDGVVIAADAQESDRYYKRSQQKILPFISNPTMACAFTGAGDAGYLDAFFDYALKSIPVNANHNELELFFADKVKTFHEQHLFPLALQVDPPSIDILIGVYASCHTYVFVSHGSTLRKAFPHSAVGAGAHFASGLIYELSDKIRDLRRTELLAAYIIGMTKESIENCGKYTAIYSLHNSHAITTSEGSSQLRAPSELITHVSPRTIHAWEESFGTKWGPRQTELIDELIEEELGDSLSLQLDSQTSA